MKVLFCGKEFSPGFTFTKEALAGDAGVEVVRCERAQLSGELAQADVAVPLMSRLDAALLAGAPRLQLIMQFGVGVEGIDIPAATDLGIWVSNIPSAGTGNATSCAEHAIYLTLAALRQHNAMADSIQNRLLGVPLGQTLLGKTALILGFGNIAKELAVRLKPFGVRITALRRKPWGGSGHSGAQDAHQQQQQNGQQNGQPQQQVAEPPGHDPELEAAALATLSDKGCWGQDTARLAGEADIVVVTCHQDEQNRGMIDGAFLAACKPGVQIVNVARGGLLDYEAVRAGLASGHVAGLALDVHEFEPIDPQHWLVTHPQVYLTPHIGGVTEISYRNMAKLVADAVRRLQRGEPPARLLNAPAAPRGLAA